MNNFRVDERSAVFHARWRAEDFLGYGVWAFRSKDVATFGVGIASLAVAAAEFEAAPLEGAGSVAQSAAPQQVGPALGQPPVALLLVVALERQRRVAAVQRLVVRLVKHETDLALAGAARSACFNGVNRPGFFIFWFAPFSSPLLRIVRLCHCGVIWFQLNFSCSKLLIGC